MEKLRDVRISLGVISKEMIVKGTKIEALSEGETVRRTEQMAEGQVN